MKPTPKEVILSLKTGDLLVIPHHDPALAPQDRLFAAVLRTSEAGLYLSMRFVGEIDPIPYVSRNPFRWDDGIGALVDRSGEVPNWYYPGIDIRVEPGGARRLAEEYAAIPRREHLKHTMTKQDMALFKQADPRYKQLFGVVVNGEAGALSEQLSLMLDVVGIDRDHSQHVGICWILMLLMQEAAADSHTAMPKVDAALAGGDASFVFPAVGTTRQ